MPLFMFLVIPRAAAMNHTRINHFTMYSTTVQTCVVPTVKH